MSPRLPGIGSHHAANPQTDEWLTPPEISTALAPFDLDPCAPHQRPDWTGAAATYTVEDDGLTAPWAGFVSPATTPRRTMGTNSHIEWTDDTWNVVIGCTRCSAGCDHCYAIGQVHRALSPQHVGLTIKPTAQQAGVAAGIALKEEVTGRPAEHVPDQEMMLDAGLVERRDDKRIVLTPLGRSVAKNGSVVDWTGEVRLVPHLFDYPTRHRTGRRIFVNSLSDWFTPEVLKLDNLGPTAPCVACGATGRVVRSGVERACRFCKGRPDGQVETGIRFPRWPLVHLVAEMVANPQHTFQILTKRPKLMARVLALPQFRLDVNAALLERGHPVMPGGMTDHDFRWPNHLWWGASIEANDVAWRADDLRQINGVLFISAEPAIGSLTRLDLTGIDWLIVGGESGQQARPMHPEWARDLRDRALAAGVPFFFKQWGTWCPQGQVPLESREGLPDQGTHTITMDGELDAKPVLGRVGLYRLGKDRSGRLLDGETWSQIPEVA